MKQMNKPLRQVSSMRTIGFATAVADLGTHILGGREVNYTTCQVRKVLKGEHKSERLLELIAEKRPDLFGLWFVHADVRKWFADRVDDTGDELYEDQDENQDAEPLTAEERRDDYLELCADAQRDEWE